MADQDFDLSGIPAATGKGKGPGDASASPESFNVSGIPKAAQPQSASAKGTLGKPTKPASLKAGGGVLYESIPMITGATGGIAATAAAAPTAAVSGPVGPAVAGVAGAGTGGLLGRYVQYGLQRIFGGTGLGDALGIPDLSEPQKKRGAIGTVGEAGSEATTQMEYEMGGHIFGAPLGFIRRGGFLKFNRDVMATLAEDAKRGTRLSGPEIASGSTVGDIAKNIQSYSAGAFGAGPMQRGVRTEGSAAALRELDAAVRLVAPSATKVEAGRAAEAGLGAAKAGQRVVGQQLDRIAESAPPVNMTDIKAEAVDEIRKTIGPRLSTFPDVANNPKTAQIIRQVRSDPTYVQRMPRPEMERLLDVILEKTNSPTLRTLRELIGAEDSAPFRGVWEQSKVLRAASTPQDQIFAKNDAQRVATRFNGMLRQAMGAASPEFDRVAAQYRAGANVLESRAVKKILATAVQQPEAVVAMMKGNPTRAAQLQRSLKAIAARGPDKARAEAAYDLIRSTYFQHIVIEGDKPMPGTEDGINKMLTSFGQRLRAETQSGVIPQWFSDARGKALLANATAVANLMEKRSPVMQGNLRKIFEIGRIMGGAMTLAGQVAAGRPLTPAAMTTAAVWEGFPDFFTWVIHNPKATRWFIEGVQAENPVHEQAAVIRLFELWRKHHQEMTQGMGPKSRASIEQGVPLLMGGIGGLPEGLNAGAIDELLMREGIPLANEAESALAPVAGAAASRVGRTIDSVSSQLLKDSAYKRALDRFFTSTAQTVTQGIPK